MVTGAFIALPLLYVLYFGLLEGKARPLEMLCAYCLSLLSGIAAAALLRSSSYIIPPIVVTLTALFVRYKRDKKTRAV